MEVSNHGGALGLTRPASAHLVIRPSRDKTDRMRRSRVSRLNWVIAPENVWQSEAYQLFRYFPLISHDKVDTETRKRPAYRALADAVIRAIEAGDLNS